MNGSKLNLRKISLLSLALLMFSLPFGGKIVPIFLAIGLAAVTYAKVKAKWKLDFTTGRFFYLPFALFFGIHFLGLLWSDNLVAALKVLEHKMSFLIVPILLVLFNPKKKEAILLFKMFTFSVLCIIVISFVFFFYLEISTGEFIILGEIEAGNRPGTRWEYLSKHFIYVNIHRTYFSAYIVAALLFIFNYFSYFISWFGSKSKLLGYFSIILLMAAIIVIQSKAGLATFIIVLIYSLFSKLRIAKIPVPFKIAGLASILLVVSIYFMLPTSRFNLMLNEINNISGNTQNGDQKVFTTVPRPGSTEIRYMLYYSSISLIKESPIIGYGTGDVKDVLAKRNLENGFDNIAKMRYGPHSQFLTTSLGLGFIGVVGLLLLFFAPFSQLIKKGNIFGIALVMILFFNCLFESFLSRQDGIIFTVVSLSLLASLNGPKTQTAK